MIYFVFISFSFDLFRMTTDKSDEIADQNVRRPVNPATCLLEIVQTINNETKLIVPPTAAETKPFPQTKRLGRGVVNTGLTCECGVFGAMACGEWPTQRVSLNDNFSLIEFADIFGFLRKQIEIAQTICLGLVALQHRGQESAGIVTSEGNSTKNFNVYKGMGMINHIFNDEAIRKLKGNLGIGHTRYSTSASSEEVNCQPFVVHTQHGAMAVAHNGELVNCESLRRNVLERGVGLSTHSDSELITQALCLNPPEGEDNGPDWPARIKHLIQLAPLSYSLVIMMKDKIYGVRDPYGNRPLCLGKIVPVKPGNRK